MIKKLFARMIRNKCDKAIDRVSHMMIERANKQANEHMRGSAHVYIAATVYEIRKELGLLE